AEEQIIVELIHQQTLGAHTIESLEQQRAQKPLGWNAEPSMPGIELGECPRQTMKHFIDKHTDRAQRMIGRNPPLNIHVAEELDRRLVSSPHRVLLDPGESIASEPYVYGITSESS